MSWIVYVILYLIIAVVFNQFYKITTKTLTKPGALTVLLQSLGAITILLLCPFLK